MTAKFFEVRDKGTFIPVLAFRLIPAPRTQGAWLCDRAGFRRPDTYVFYMPLDGAELGRVTYDMYDWRGRTHPVAHKYIAEHFDELESGAVVDVEFVLGETHVPKVSERREMEGPA